MSQNGLLVYVQAVPDAIPVSAKRLQDLSNSKFKMSHSSKTALALATNMGFKEIVAAGYNPILSEAIARGATSVASIPLFDDPIKQADSLPSEPFDHILIGENEDWFFSGASLAGVLARSRKFRFTLAESSKITQYPSSSVIAVRDEGENSPNIDVRRINESMVRTSGEGEILGNFTFSKIEESRTELIVGDSGEIGTAIFRKLRRLVA